MEPMEPMELTEELKTDDRVVGEHQAIKSKRGSVETGYPYDLTEDEVASLYYFFGARKANSKALGGASAATRDFTTDETRMLNKIMVWFGFVATNPRERKAAYRAVTIRFKAVSDFLRTHPAFITVPIRKALEECGYQRLLSNIVMVVSADGKIQPRVVGSDQKKAITPIGQLDQLMWEFQNVALDKLRLIIDSIEPKDIKKSNLGMKSKALRDIYSVIHMVRLGNKNPNLTLVNVNVNSENKDKLSAYGAYISKNREVA